VPAAGIVEGAMWALALALLGTCFATLATVGLSSWRRTRPLRRGETAALPLHPDTPAGGGRTSRVTYAPAIAGVAIVAIGCLAAASRARPLLVVGLATAGVTVAISGLSGRVTAIQTRPQGLVVRYAQRGPFALPWGQCEAVRPPRWPLGGWKIERADGATRVLMPSDLRGLEWVLAACIDGAGLRFDGKAWGRATGSARAWTRPRAPARGGRGSSAAGGSHGERPHHLIRVEDAVEEVRPGGRCGEAVVHRSGAG
jgi:hypothetical protein